MKLAEYIAQHGITQAAFAIRVGVSQSDIAKYLAGRLPRPAVMALIVSETDGQVTPNDFYDVADPQTSPSTSAAA